MGDRSTETVDDGIEDWTVVSDGNRTTPKENESGRLPGTTTPFSLSVQPINDKRIQEGCKQQRVLKSKGTRRKLGISTFAGSQFAILENCTSRSEETTPTKKTKLYKHCRLSL